MTSHSTLSTMLVARRLLLGALLLGFALPAAAQQRVGYVDSEFILSRMPDFTTAQQQIDRLAEQWRAELDERGQAVRQLEQEFAARDLLYTDEERERRQREITDLRREQEALRLRYFGPEGELFREQTRLLRPIQERVLTAVEAVATDGSFDYVFDTSGDYVFLYARPQLDLSERVLMELGIDVAPGVRR